MAKNSSLNLFKRAFLNVVRTKTKSIILILTFFLIGNFVIIGLGVSSAADNAKTLTRKKMRAVISYEVDYDEVDKYTNTLSDEEINEFWNSNATYLKYEYIKNYKDDDRVLTIQASSYSRNICAPSEGGIEYVPIDNEEEANRKEMIENGEDMMYYPGDFFLKTNLFPDCIELVEGTFFIVDGEFYSQEDIDKSNDVIVITKQLAEKNNLRVGDKVEFLTEGSGVIDDYLDVVPDLKEEDFHMILTIKGIYDHTNVLTPDKENYNYMQPYENPDNLVLMPASTLQKYLANTEQRITEYYNQLYSEEGYYSSNTNVNDGSIDSILLSNVKIFLKDPLDVDDFISENESNVPQFFKLNANNDEFKKLSKPLDTLSMYSNLIIWLVVINAIVIITLVVALTLKTREYEIGVLLSIGASKIKIILQFFSELAIVALIGFTLSTVTGSLVTSKIGNTVLDYQIQRDELDNDDYYYYDSVWSEDYFTHITLDDLVEEYDSSVSPIIIVEIYIMGLGIVFISTLIPALMIMRFNPKRILMNQN